MHRLKYFGFNVIKESFDHLPSGVCFLITRETLYFATDRCKIYLSSLSRTDGFFLFCYNKIKEKNTSDMSQKERGMV